MRKLKAVFLYLEGLIKTSKDSYSWVPNLNGEPSEHKAGMLHILPQCMVV
jgi:hypothetical protein